MRERRLGARLVVVAEHEAERDLRHAGLREIGDDRLELAESRGLVVLPCELGRLERRLRRVGVRGLRRRDRAELGGRARDVAGARSRERRLVARVDRVARDASRSSRPRRTSSPRDRSARRAVAPRLGERAHVRVASVRAAARRRASATAARAPSAPSASARGTRSSGSSPSRRPARGARRPARRRRACASRCVTARMRRGPDGVDEQAEPRAARATASPVSGASRSTLTMFVSTRARSTLRAVDARGALGEGLRGGVILDEALAMVAQCMERGRGEDAGLAHAAAPHLAEASRALDVPRARRRARCRPARRGPSRSRR